MMTSTTTRKGWIVRTGKDYLFPQGGDVGYTPNLADPGVFETEEDAVDAGREHCEPGFVVIRDPR